MRRHRAGLRDKGGDLVRGGRSCFRQRFAGRSLLRCGYFACGFRFGRFAGHEHSQIAASSMWAGIEQAVNAGSLTARNGSGRDDAAPVSEQRSVGYRRRQISAGGFNAETSPSAASSMIFGGGLGIDRRERACRCRPGTCRAWSESPPSPCPARCRACRYAGIRYPRP